jgi:hypothetical protein
MFGEGTQLYEVPENQWAQTALFYERACARAIK